MTIHTTQLVHHMQHRQSSNSADQQTELAARTAVQGELAVSTITSQQGRFVFESEWGIYVWSLLGFPLKIGMNGRANGFDCLYVLA